MKTNFNAELKRMEREYSRLCQHHSMFTKIKQEMNEIVARSATDPAAQKKLNDLRILIPLDIEKLEKQARKDMQALNVAVKQLQSRLNNIVNQK